MKVEKVGGWVWYGAAIAISIGEFLGDPPEPPSSVLAILLCILIARSYDR